MSMHDGIVCLQMHLGPQKTCSKTLSWIREPQTLSQTPQEASRGLQGLLMILTGAGATCCCQCSDTCSMLDPGAPAALQSMP